MVVQQAHHRPARPWDNPFQASPRRYYTRPVISNTVANLYAFGFTLVIALIIMGALGLRKLYLKKEYEAELRERREQFKRIQTDYQAGSIEKSLIALAGLSPFKLEEDDMAIFQKQIFNEIMYRGEENYAQKNFYGAIHYFELVEHYSPYRPLAIKARLASSYRFAHNPDRSLFLLRELIEEDYETTATLVQMAEVYRYELKDTTEALRYYELARETARDEYVRRFGEAYPITLQSAHISIDHYYLFTGLGDLYLELGRANEAGQTARWIKRVWPDSLAGYIMSGKSALALGQGRAGCNDFWVAKVLGYTEKLPRICR
jgi:predicted Zn-dependent protease